MIKSNTPTILKNLTKWLEPHDQMFLTIANQIDCPIQNSSEHLQFVQYDISLAENGMNVRKKKIARTLSSTKDYQ